MNLGAIRHVNRVRELEIPTVRARLLPDFDTIFTLRDHKPV